MTEPVEMLSFRKAMKVAKDSGSKKHILLGNGFSIGAHGQFKYGSLYQQARKSGLLSKQVQTLFDWYGTTNFEEVLRQLGEAQRIAKLYELNGANKSLSMKKDREKVKEALVNTIAAIHPATRNEFSDQKLQACNEFLSPFHNVFTTNYDLLLYWANLVKIRFNDGFSVPDSTSTNCLLFADVPPSPNQGEHFMYFLHGALHLYAEQMRVRKVVWGGANPPLIDQIKEALADDRFPLVVSEGNPGHKLERIDANDYLRACRKNFRMIKGSLFVFGSSLGQEDTHILDWIAGNSNIERLYVGVHGDPNEERNQKMITRIRRRVDPNYEQRRRKQSGRVVFYDSDTAQVWTAPPVRREKVSL